MLCDSKHNFNMFDIATWTTENIGKRYHIDGMSHWIVVPPTGIHGHRIFEFPHVLADWSDKTIKYFDVRQREWAVTRGVNPVRGQFAVACLTDTEVVICGCEKKSDSTEGICFLFNTDTHETTELPKMASCRAYPVVLHYRGTVVAIGACLDAGGWVCSCEQYIPGAVAWEPMGELAKGDLCLQAVAVDDRIYAITGLCFLNAHMYDGATWHVLRVTFDGFDSLRRGLFNYKGAPAVLGQKGQIQMLDTEAGVFHTVDGVTGPCDELWSDSEIHTV